MNVEKTERSPKLKCPKSEISPKFLRTFPGLSEFATECLGLVCQQFEKGINLIYEV